MWLIHTSIRNYYLLFSFDVYFHSRMEIDKNLISLYNIQIQKKTNKNKKWFQKYTQHMIMFWEATTTAIFIHTHTYTHRTIAYIIMPNKFVVLLWVWLSLNINRCGEFTHVKVVVKQQVFK